MKKIILGICLFLASFSLFAADVNYKPGTYLYVSVKSTKLGKTEVQYGDILVFEAAVGKKLQVHKLEDESVAGLIAAGSVTKKKIVKSENGSTVRASSDELALAGKGFSETAESVYKSEHTEIHFDVIDEMEKIVISEEDVNDFIKEGSLCAE